jgi:hypothetical protein
MEKFLVYVEEIEALKELSNEEMGVFFRAMVYFVKTGIVPELSEKMRYAFRFVVAHIERDQKKYSDVSAKRRNSGRKGAQATWEKKKGQDIKLEEVVFVSDDFEKFHNTAADDIGKSFEGGFENDNPPKDNDFCEEGVTEHFQRDDFCEEGGSEHFERDNFCEEGGSEHFERDDFCEEGGSEHFERDDFCEEGVTDHSQEGGLRKIGFLIDESKREKKSLFKRTSGRIGFSITDSDGSTKLKPCCTSCGFDREEVLMAAEEKTPNGTNAPSKGRDLFEEFWKSYPKKVNESSARKAYISQKLTLDEHKKMMASLEKQKRSSQWKRENGRFIPFPTKWIVERRWESAPVELSDSSGEGLCSFDIDEFLEAATKKSGCPSFN